MDSNRANVLCSVRTQDLHNSRSLGHCAAKGGRQKGIGKTATKNKKKVTESDRKREKGYQKVTEKDCE